MIKPAGVTCTAGITGCDGVLKWTDDGTTFTYDSSLGINWLSEYHSGPFEVDEICFYHEVSDNEMKPRLCTRNQEFICVAKVQP